MICSNQRDQLIGVSLSLVAAFFIALCGPFFQQSRIGSQFSILTTGLVGFLSGFVGLSIDTTQKAATNLSSLVITITNGLICGGVSNVLFILALDFVAAGDATACAYFSSFLAGLFWEAVLLKVCPHYCSLVSAAIGLLGLILVSLAESEINRGFGYMQIVGIGLSTLSGSFIGLFYVLVRKYPESNCYIQISSYYVGCCIYPLPGIFQDWEKPTVCFSILDWILVLCGSCFYVAPSYLSVFASKLISPALSCLWKTLRCRLNTICDHS